MGLFGPGRRFLSGGHHTLVLPFGRGYWDIALAPGVSWTPGTKLCPQRRTMLVLQHHSAHKVKAQPHDKAACMGTRVGLHLAHADQDSHTHAARVAI